MRTILAVVLTLLSNAALALPTFEYHLLYEDEVVTCDSRLIGVWLKPEGEKDLVIKRVDKITHNKIIKHPMFDNFASKCSFDAAHIYMVAYGGLLTIRRTRNGPEDLKVENPQRFP